MFALTPNQIAAIQAFNASRISVTDFSDSLKAFGIVIEELCPTPTDVNDVMGYYGEHECVRINRESSADYGSHAALQVIVLSRKQSEEFAADLKPDYCIVSIGRSNRG